MKVLLLFLTLALCVFINLILPYFVNLPLWYSYVTHFFIAGMLTACFAAEFWIWYDPKSFYESKKFLIFIGILSGDALGGIFWEIFEYWYLQGEAAYSGNGAWFYSDTIWDLQMNFFGALIIALTYTLKNIEYKRINILKRKMGAK